MAVDTREKRQSTVAIGLMPIAPSITPSGAITTADRFTIGYGYSGFAAADQSTLACDTGAFTLTGIDATLTKPGVATIAAETGAFLLAGVDAALTVSRLLDAVTGPYTLVGNDVTFTSGLSFAADTGVFALAGVDVVLDVSRTLSSDAGAFVVAGLDAGLVKRGPVTEAGYVCIRDVTISTPTAAADLAVSYATATLKCRS